MNDHLVRILSNDGSLRAVAAVTSGLTRTICRLQGTDPTASVALGRLVAGTALLGALLKGNQRLALMIEGNGPLQRLHSETDAYGQLRGSVKNPLAALPPKADRFDVAGAVGKAGFLHVIKDLGMKEPYRGMVQLYTSEIAEDLAYYLTTSEQIPSTVGLGVTLDENFAIATAGGFLVQAMPGGDESLIPLLEERLQQLPPATSLLSEGKTPLQILEQLFAGIPFSVQMETPLEFRCNCSRPQVAAMLRGLGADEVRAMIEEDQGAEVTCEFCKQSYAFTAEELAALPQLKS
ncbi:Hsp33 family molecular chaperone HslO [Trichloromonas sp.]|uniref:Hsp33 family molecular chaperone HslO n=1 Tax=Trichloromonas sp. TaxID=3069249 RepID=UPI003D81728F